MEKSFRNLVDSSKSILILLPTRAKLDEVAAGLSLYLSIREGREVSIHGPDQMTVNYNRLIGVNKISQELGNKNLVIRFTGYSANDIERVSYDIEGGEFKLTVIPKTNVSAPAKDQVGVEYSGVSADLVVLVGGIDEQSFPALSSKELNNLKTVHLGSRQVKLGKTQVLSFAKAASSNSEVVAGLLKDSGYEIGEDVATNLLMGIEEASSNFMSDMVTADTFSIFSELLKAGGKRVSRISQQTRAYPPGAIPGQMPVQQFAPTGAQQIQSMPVQPPAAGMVSDRNDTAETETPKDWYTRPKVYKGTSNS